MEDNRKKFEELMKDPEFARKFLTQKTPEDAQEFLEKNGVEATVDEIKKVGEILAKVRSGEMSAEQVAKAADGELSEEELEQVAGGFLIVSSAVGCYVISNAALAWIGVGSAVAVGGGIAAAENWDTVKSIASDVWDVLTSW